MIAHEIMENDIRMTSTALTIYPALRMSWITELFMYTPYCF